MSDPLRPGRKATDESLRKERDKSDHEVERLDREGFQADDQVVQRGRDAADEILRKARASEIANLEVSERRREEDARIHAARSRSDEELRGERSDRAQALKALFEVERTLTDAALRSERALADVALAARDEFLGIVAHDLRTPLTQISLRAAFLRTDAPGGEEGNVVRRTSASIERAVRRMDALVGDLLDAAAIESGTLPVVLSKQDLTPLVSDVAGDLRLIAEERRLALVFDGSESVFVLCDKGRMAQCLGNLLTNAIKFTPSGGRIVVRVAAEKGRANVSVGDTGVGIPAERMRTIFDRSWETRTGDRSGLGLGLYIARHIIHAHGGKLEAQSTVRLGSTFSFTLPCVE